jgi:hypothetical protein
MWYGLQLDDPSKVMKLHFEDLQRRPIHNIEDLLRLMFKDYGWPTIVNFPIVDAVILLRNLVYFLQMTISEQHPLRSEEAWVEILEKCLAAVEHLLSKEVAAAHHEPNNASLSTPSAIAIDEPDSVNDIPQPTTIQLVFVWVLDESNFASFRGEEKLQRLFDEKVKMRRE